MVKAVRDILGNPAKNPFPILCGTSAGAINAATLAVFADDFTRGVGNLLEVWEHMRCEPRLPHRSAGSIMKSGVRWLASMMLISRHNPISLLDNAPLARACWRRTSTSSASRQHIDAGRALRGVRHRLGLHLRPERVVLPGRQRPGGLGAQPAHRRGGRRCKLEYLLASAALPFIFPAVKVHREYFGDGSMRQIAPVSPALHLGADRVLIVGTGRQTAADQARARSNVYPSLAQIAGHALNSIFLDSLMVDIERLERINRTVKLIPQERLTESRLSCGR